MVEVGHGLAEEFDVFHGVHFPGDGAAGEVVVEAGVFAPSGFRKPPF